MVQETEVLEPKQPQLADAIVGTGEDAMAVSLQKTRRRQNKQLSYWRMCADEACTKHQDRKGWIIMGPTLQLYTSMEYIEFQEFKHATCLTEYGSYDLDEMREPWNRWKHLIARGGLKEMPAEQMAMYGWHRLPEAVAARPELIEWQQKEIICDHGCPTTGLRVRRYFVQDEYTKHVRNLHKEAAAPTAIGKVIAEAIAAVGTPAANIDVNVLAAAIVAAERAKVELEADEPSKLTDEQVFPQEAD